MKNNAGEPRSSRPLPKGKAPERVLIIRLQAVGDVVLTLPACASLRQRFPSARISMLTSQMCADIPAAVRLFDHVMVFPQPADRPSRFLEAVIAGIRMRSHHYDLIIDLQRHLRSRLVRILARPRAWAEFDRFSPRPALERTLDTFRRAGLPDLAPVYRLDLKPEILKHSRDLLLSHGWDGSEKLVLLNPAGLWPTRNWPMERYAELAASWLELEQVKFLFLGTERVYAKTRDLVKNLSTGAIDLVGRTSLGEAFGVVQHASAAISEDSGLLHMAWVSGVPTVALLGSTRSDWTRPMGAHTRFVASEDLPCGACMKPVCRFGDVHCLSRHSADQIFRLAMEARDGPHSPH